MTDTEKERAPSLVRGFIEPSPSKEFVLKRKQEDGSVVDFPLRCRLLRSDQVIEVLEAAQVFSEKRELRGHSDIYREAQAHEAIARAICMPEIHEKNGRKFLQPYFLTAQQVRENLDEIECARMLDFIQLTKEFYRTANVIEEEDVDEMIEALSDEMMGPYFLSHTDSADWPSIIYGLAKKANALWKMLGSIQPDSQTSSESTPSTSDPGTTGPSEQLDAHMIDSGETRQLHKQIRSREDAREFVKKQRLKTPPSDETDE